MIRKDVEVLSKRGTMIPATVVIGNEKEKAPLVVFVHGFKAERTELNRHMTVAEKLAVNDGVNSIMMDFAGCGVSKEDFINYSITSIMDDIDSCVAYMKENYVVDEEHLGISGYSMGGRTVAIYTYLHPEFKVMASWAGALFTAFNNQPTYLGGNVEEMKAACAKEGSYLLFNAFDSTYIRISAQLMEDTEKYDPIACLNEYKGCAIICQGDQDDTVDPSVSIEGYLALKQAEKRMHVMVHGANHGFGAWDNHPEQSKILTDETYRFFKENL